MISRLLTTLYAAGLELTAEEVAEALWLAEQIKQATTEDKTASQEDTNKEREMHQATEIVAPDAQPVSQLRDINEMRSSDSDTSEQKRVGGDLYLRSERAINTEENHLPGLPIRSPTGSALPGTLGIARALRPLMRHIPSKMLLTLDEEATINRFAEECIWSLEFKPVKEHWLEVALVVDEGRSMVIWQQTIEELRFLLEHHGAFSNVSTWGLVTDVVGEAVWLHRGTGLTTDSRQRRNPRELLDPQGRRLIMLVTDCVSTAWLDGTLTPMLEIWSRTNPVVIVQMLPQRLWYRTGLGLAIPTQLEALAPGIPNARLVPKVANPAKQSLPGLRMPVITLEAKPVLGWSRMVAGIRSASASGFLIARNPLQDNEYIPGSNHQISTEELLAAERVRRFRTSSSPLARQLASLLAAAPVSLPVARLIQQSMLPESRQVHLAEVFLGGLLEEVTSSTNEADYVEYEFIDGVRDQLLNSISVSSALQVLTNVSHFINIRFGQSRDFQAILAMPNLLEHTITIDERSRPFALVATKVLERLGGEYAALAAEFEMILSPQGEIPTQPLPLPIKTPPIEKSTEERRPVGIPGQAFLNRLAKEFTGLLSLYKENERHCPSCMELFYPGECDIVATRNSVAGPVGTVLKKGLAKGTVNARRNIERLVGERYTLSLARARCPNCGYFLPYNIGSARDLTIAIIGDTSSGKSSYISAIVKQFNEGKWVQPNTSTIFSCLTPDINDYYTDNYFRPLFEEKQVLRPTQMYIDEKHSPLIYELTIKSSPDRPAKSTNIIIYDTSGDDYMNQDRLVHYARYVLSADAIIYLVDPLAMQEIADALPAFLQPQQSSQPTPAEGLNRVLNLIERFHGGSGNESLRSLPIAITLSKADLLKYVTPVSYQYNFLRPHAYQGGVDFKDLQVIDQEVRHLLGEYGENMLLQVASTFSKVQFFATSATGYSSDLDGHFPAVEPQRCLDPVLWILQELKLL